MGRIVIIDDDRILAKLLGAEIRSLGHTVICAHTLKEGLDYVRENPVDLIFLDVFLPDGNGLDALGTIFKMPAATGGDHHYGRGGPGRGGTRYPKRRHGIISRSRLRPSKIWCSL